MKSVIYPALASLMLLRAQGEVINSNNSSGIFITQNLAGSQNLVIGYPDANYLCQQNKDWLDLSKQSQLLYEAHKETSESVILNSVNGSHMDKKVGLHNVRPLRNSAPSVKDYSELDLAHYDQTHDYIQSHFSLMKSYITGKQLISHNRSLTLDRRVIADTKSLLNNPQYINFLSNSIDLENIECYKGAFTHILANWDNLMKEQQESTNYLHNIKMELILGIHFSQNSTNGQEKMWIIQDNHIIDPPNRYFPTNMADGHRYIPIISETIIIDSLRGKLPGTVKVLTFPKDLSDKIRSQTE